MKKEIDLFDKWDELPPEVNEVINKYGEIESYTDCKNMLKELAPLGYTFEYYLDAIPFNLKKI